MREQVQAVITEIYNDFLFHEIRDMFRSVLIFFLVKETGVSRYNLYGLVAVTLAMISK